MRRYLCLVLCVILALACSCGKSSFSALTDGQDDDVQILKFQSYEVEVPSYMVMQTDEKTGAVYLFAELAEASETEKAKGCFIVLSSKTADKSVKLNNNALDILTNNGKKELFLSNNKGTKIADFTSDVINTGSIKGYKYHVDAGEDAIVEYVVFADRDKNSLDFITLISYGEVGRDYTEIFDKIVKSVRKTGVNLNVDPDLKAFLDSYEEFIDEYVYFMEKYTKTSESGDYFTLLSMLQNYNRFMMQLSDFEKKSQKYNAKNLSKDDYAYYLETLGRIQSRLLDIYK